MDLDRPPPTFSDTDLKKSRQEIEVLMDKCPGITSVIITTNTADVVLDVLQADIHPFKLSTMTGSLMDLSEMIAEESLQQDCRFAIVETTEGRVISMRINHDLVLTCISNPSSNLGMVLNSGRATADRLAQLLIIVEENYLINDDDDD